MYGLPERCKPLSGAEEQVLLALWEKAPATRREIGQRLKAKGWADGTLLTFLGRLEAKGWVKVTRDANRNVYEPVVTRRAYGVYCMRERLDALFGGGLAAAVRALVSESGAGPSQLDQAEAVLEEMKTQAEEYDSYDAFF